MNVLLAVLGNMVIGACILALIDNNERTLFNWFKSIRTGLAWFIWPLVLSLWFIPAAIHTKARVGGWMS